VVVVGSGRPGDHRRETDAGRKKILHGQSRFQVLNGAVHIAEAMKDGAQAMVKQSPFLSGGRQLFINAQSQGMLPGLFQLLGTLQRKVGLPTFCSMPVGAALVHEPILIGVQSPSQMTGPFSGGEPAAQ
jgi:hypothetical protein